MVANATRHGVFHGMSSLRPILSLLLALALLSPPVHGQLRAHGPILLELPASTRGLGLGGAFPLARMGADALFHNPALLQNASGVLASGQRYGPGTLLVSFAGISDWLGGGVGIGFRQLAYGATSQFPSALPADPGSLFETGGEGASETVVVVGYAKTLFGVRLGVAGKLIDQRLGGSRSAVAASDVGATYPLGPVIVAAGVKNLGPEMSLRGEEIPLPVIGAIGATTEFAPVGPFDLSGTLQVARDGNGEIVPSGGIEVAWWPIVGRTIVGRIGYTRVPSGSADPLTFGASILLDDFILEYAYQSFGSNDRAHRISVGWR